MRKEENEFRKRIRPIHIQIIFSWLDFPIFFLLPFRKLKLDQNPIIGKKNRNWDTSKCPLVWLSWKSTTPFRPRLQSNLQKYERRSEGHNINVISDIPTLQQFLDIVANFLFPLFPLENIKKNRGNTLRYIYAVFLTKKVSLIHTLNQMSFHVFRCKKAKSTCFNANFHYISLKCMCCRYLTMYSLRKYIQIVSEMLKTESLKL